MTVSFNTDLVMMDDRTSSEAASPVDGLSDETNVSFAKSEMQTEQQAETTPLLNAEALREVLRDVPGEHLALGKKT